MTPSLILAALWAVTANLIALVPSKRAHWPQAYALIAVGIPILGYVTYENGPWWGLGVLLAGASILRWPVRYLVRWARRQITPDPPEPGL